MSCSPTRLRALPKPALSDSVSRTLDTTSLTRMLVFHTPLSVLHDPLYEILSGCAQPYFESPDRIALILAALLTKDTATPANTASHFEERRCDWTRDEIAADRELMEAVARVHSRDYLDFLREIYDEWVAEGGSKVSDCRPRLSAERAAELTGHKIALFP